MRSAPARKADTPGAPRVLVTVRQQVRQQRDDHGQQQVVGEQREAHHGGGEGGDGRRAARPARVTRVEPAALHGATV